MIGSQGHLVTLAHGQQPPIILRFAIPIIYFTCHDILNILSQTLGLTVLVRVDDLTYLFMGNVDPNLINGTVYTSFVAVGPSSTILGGEGGPMQMNLTFLNPIEVRFHNFVDFNATYASS